MDVFTQLVVGGATVLAAVVCVCIGLRGRRVGEEPHCRKCGYDLRGKPDDVVICSECGTDLSRPRALRRGSPEVWHEWLIVAVPVLLVGSIVAGNAVQALRTTEWQLLKPVWWLRLELTSSNSDTKRAAHAELCRRLSGNELDDAQLLSVARMALSPGFSPAQIPRISVDCIARAWTRNLLSEREWEQLRSRMVKFTLRAPASVGGSAGRNGFAYDIDVELAEGVLRHTTARLTVRSAEIDGRPVDCERAYANFEQNSNRAARRLDFGSMRIVPTERQWVQIGPGTHVLRLTISPACDISSLSTAQQCLLPDRVIEARFEVVDEQRTARK